MSILINGYDRLAQDMEVISDASVSKTSDNEQFQRVKEKKDVLL